MAPRRGRGGYQRPSNPAPTSGPGKFSRRTDGGVGDMRMGRGLDYGDNKAINSLQAAAPTAAQGGPSGGQRGGTPSSGRATRGSQGIFGPTDRPGEPLTAGVDFGEGPGRTVPLLPENPNMLLQALAQQTGHPDIVRLVERGGPQ